MVKYIEPKEFKEFGYLLEANRQFFHPLGLALAVEHDTETGEYRLTGLYDYRDDPEGCLFGPWDPEDFEKAKRVKSVLTEKAAVRMERYGFVVQPMERLPDADHP